MKSNKVFSVLFVLFFIPYMQAHPVDTAKARMIGSHFLSSQWQGKKDFSAMNLVYVAEDSLSRPLWYAFGMEEGGFVLVSAEDAVRPVLAYSFSSGFDPDHIPSPVSAWLSEYGVQIGACRSIPGAAADPMWKALEDGVVSTKGMQAVQPLVTTRWGQDGTHLKDRLCNHYNLYCPYDTAAEKHTLTGCVATAMAQLMRYWRYPAQGAGAYTYRHAKYGTLSVDFERGNYRYDSMADTYDCDSRIGQVQAVSELMYHCGVSVEMDYGVDGSSAKTNGSKIRSAEYALRMNFGFPDVLGVSRADYSDDNAWLRLIKAELDAGRPVLYAGSSRISGGHAFVCDGYDANGYLHFNWGWSGSMDGYFSIAALKPGTSNFTDEQRALIGIAPMEQPLCPDARHILYVSENGSGTRDGSSWGNATSKLAQAVSRASTQPLQVWVKAGHYRGDGRSENAFVVAPNVSVYGGFQGNETGNFDLGKRNLEANATVLDGQDTQRVLLLSASENGQYASADGLTITHGRVSGVWDNGGGVLAESGSRLSQCRIEHCTVNGKYGGGGGVALAHAAMSHCTVMHCDATNANGGGGMLAVSKSTGNTVSNSLFAYNQAKFGGGAIAWGVAEFVNCNFIANRASGNGSGAYVGSFDDTCRFFNCIFWRNRWKQYPSYQLSNGDSPIEVAYCGIENKGYASEGSHLLWLDSLNEGSRTDLGYPFFTDPGKDDFHLQPTSSCIDAGSNSKRLPVTDMEGNRRVFKEDEHGVVDLGIYEFSRAYAAEKEHYDTICQGRKYAGYGFTVTTFSSGDTLCFRESADTLFMLHLYVRPAVKVEETAFISPARPSYTWEDSVYTQRGDYRRVYVAANGCDSIRILHLLDNERVTEPGLRQGLRVFPNPVVSELTLAFDEAVFPLAEKVVVRDVSGRVLYVTERLSPEMRIQTEAWASGIYLLSVYGKDASACTLKIVRP